MRVAVVNLKGGVGKSLVSLHLAGEAYARGVRTLVADADMQRSALMWSDEASRRGEKGPTVIGAGTGLATQLPALTASFDLTFIDTPPRGDVVTRSAIFVADLVVVPTGPAPTDFWALSTTVELCKQALALKPNLRVVLLLNRTQPRQGLSMHAREALQHLDLPVLDTTLGNRTAFAESLAYGATASRYAPTSEAADEVRRLYDELLGQARATEAA